MAKKKYIYCWNCGLKNKLADEKCTKCKKKLLEEEKTELHEFVVDKLIDKAQDEGQDRLKKRFKDYVTKRLFGILLSASLVFTGSTVVANILEKMKGPKEIQTQVVAPYEFEAMMEAKEEKCDEGFTKTNGECSKEVQTPAEKTLSCEDGYTLSKNTCRQEAERVEVRECILPPDYVYSGDACTPLKVEHVTPGSIFKTECKVSAFEWVDTTDEEGNPIRKCNNGGRVDFIDPTISYKCPSGTSEIEGKCFKTSKPKESYLCPSGTLKDKNCITTEKGKLNGKCEEGYTYNEIVNLCIKD